MAFSYDSGPTIDPGPPATDAGPPVFDTPSTVFRENELRLARFVGNNILPVEMSTESQAIDGSQGSKNYHVRFVRPRFRQYDNPKRSTRAKFWRGALPKVAYRNLFLAIRIEIAQDAQMTKARVERNISIRRANEGGWIPCDVIGSHIKGTILMRANRRFLTKDLEGIDIMVDSGEDSP